MRSPQPVEWKQQPKGEITNAGRRRNNECRRRNNDCRQEENRSGMAWRGAAAMARREVSFLGVSLKRPLTRRRSAAAGTRLVDQQPPWSLDTLGVAKHRSRPEPGPRIEGGDSAGCAENGIASNRDVASAAATAAKARAERGCSNRSITPQKRQRLVPAFRRPPRSANPLAVGRSVLRKQRGRYSWRNLRRYTCDSVGWVGTRRLCPATNRGQCGD